VVDVLTPIPGADDVIAVAFREHLLSASTAIPEDFFLVRVKNAIVEVCRAGCADVARAVLLLALVNTEGALQLAVVTLLRRMIRTEDAFHASLTEDGRAGARRAMPPKCPGHALARGTAKFVFATTDMGFRAFGAHEILAFELNAPNPCQWKYPLFAEDTGISKRRSR
jgi:hypothetical protein